MGMDTSTAGCTPPQTETRSNLHRIKATSTPEVRRFPALLHRGLVPQWSKAPKPVVLATLETVRYSLEHRDIQQRGVFRVQVIGNGIGRIVCWRRRDVCLDWQEQNEEAESNCHGVGGYLDKHSGGWG